MIKSCLLLFTLIFLNSIICGGQSIKPIDRIIVKGDTVTQFSIQSERLILIGLQQKQVLKDQLYILGEELKDYKANSVNCDSALSIKDQQISLLSSVADVKQEIITNDIKRYNFLAVQYKKQKTANKWLWRIGGVIVATLTVGLLVK